MIFLCFCGLQLKAQTNENLIDRFLIKTDLCPVLLDNAYTIEAELRINEHSTISAGMFGGSDLYSQTSSFSGGSIDKGIINSQYFFGIYKFYPGKVWKAPVGSYFLAEVGYGTADISGDCSADKLDPNFSARGLADPTARPTIPYAFFDVPMAKLAIGIGTQHLMFWHFYYDFSFKFEYYTFMANDDTQSTMISGIARNYGPNLLHFSSGSDGSMGLSVNFKLGYLLY